MTSELISQLLETVLIPLLTILTGFLVRWINMKTTEAKNATKNENLKKYIDMLNDTIAKCVLATNQTYVEALKKDNAFTKEAQKEAFEKTYEAILQTISAESYEYLDAFYGDLTQYITSQIEAQVNLSKKVES